jgi:hypothetical protein
MRAMVRVSKTDPVDIDTSVLVAARPQRSSMRGKSRPCSTDWRNVSNGGVLYRVWRNKAVS